MKKFVALATASCMLVVAPAPAMAVPVIGGATMGQPAAAVTTQDAPTIGIRDKLVQRAASTPRKTSNKFLQYVGPDYLLLGFAALFSIAIGAYVATGGFDHPGSS